MSLRPRDSALPALVALVGANLLPLAGVLFGGWTVWEVLLVYWIESGIVGLFSVPRILFADGSVSLTLNGYSVGAFRCSGYHTYKHQIRN
jgi:hypothetical protein